MHIRLRQNIHELQLAFWINLTIDHIDYINIYVVYMIYDLTTAESRVMQLLMGLKCHP